jgi:hypothetical protein
VDVLAKAQTFDWRPTNGAPSRWPAIVLSVLAIGGMVFATSLLPMRETGSAPPWPVVEVLPQSATVPEIRQSAQVTEPAPATAGVVPAQESAPVKMTELPVREPAAQVAAAGSGGAEKTAPAETSDGDMRNYQDLRLYWLADRE